MKIAVRCIYYLPVSPNFLIVDLPDEEWRKFLGARENPKERIDIIRPYIKKPGPTYIVEIAWIPLDNLKLTEIYTLEEACKRLYNSEPVRTY